MLTKHQFVVVWISLFLFEPANACGQSGPEGKIKVGFVDQGWLYTLEKVKANESVPDHIILEAQILPPLTDRKVRIQEEVMKYRFDPILVGFLKSDQYRWRMAHGSFWGTGDAVSFDNSAVMRVSLGELMFFDAKNSNRVMQYHKNHRKDSRLYINAGKEMAYADYEDKHPEVLKDTIGTRGGYKNDLTHKIHGIFFDFLPTSESEFVVFVLWKDKIHVWPSSAVKSLNRYTEWCVGSA